MSGVGLEDEGEPVASAQSVQGLLDRADDVLVGRVASGHLVDGSSGEQIKLRHSGNFGLQPRETLWGTEVNPFGADGNGELPGPIAVARLEAERSQGPGGLQATVLEVDQQDPQRPGKRGECKGMQGSGEGYADLPDESGFSGPLFPCYSNTIRSPRSMRSSTSQSYSGSGRSSSASRSRPDAVPAAPFADAWTRSSRSVTSRIVLAGPRPS
jgi:hypothetical protein